MTSTTCLRGEANWPRVEPLKLGYQTRKACACNPERLRNSQLVTRSKKSGSPSHNIEQTRRGGGGGSARQDRVTVIMFVTIVDAMLIANTTARAKRCRVHTHGRNVHRHKSCPDAALANSEMTVSPPAINGISRGKAQEGQR